MIKGLRARVICWKTILSLLQNKEKHTLSVFLQEAKGSTDQENTGEGSEILERGVSGYSNRPTRGFMANGILQPGRLLFREKAKVRKAPTVQQKE